jgi:hypothetical protein
MTSYPRKQRSFYCRQSDKKKMRFACRMREGNKKHIEHLRRHFAGKRPFGRRRKCGLEHKYKVDKSVIVWKVEGHRMELYRSG